jgi:hypothetical protein
MSKVPTLAQIRAAIRRTLGDDAARVDVHDDGVAYRADCHPGFRFEDGPHGLVVFHDGDRVWKREARSELARRVSSGECDAIEACGTDCPECGGG